MRFWLAVVSHEHVKRGVGLGIAQIGHGKRNGLARMQAGDWLVYYSPRLNLVTKQPLQAFTAVGQIADDEIWQADEGDFKPWRRRVSYDARAHVAQLRPLTDVLELTSKPNWGYQLRRGLIELSQHDFMRIRGAMRAA